MTAKPVVVATDGSGESLRAVEWNRPGGRAQRRTTGDRVGRVVAQDGRAPAPGRARRRPRLRPRAT